MDALTSVWVGRDNVFVASIVVDPTRVAVAHEDVFDVVRAVVFVKVDIGIDGHWNGESQFTHQYNPSTE